MAVWTVKCRVVLPEMEAIWLNTFRNDYETKIELAFTLNRVRIGPSLDFCSDDLSLREGKIIDVTKAAKLYRALHSGEESSDQHNGDRNREQGCLGKNVTSLDERHLEKSLFSGVLGSSFGSESVLYILKISIVEERTSLWNLCCRRDSGVVNDDDELTIMGGGVIEWYQSGQQHPLTDMEKMSPTRGHYGSRHHHILLVFSTQEDQIAVSLMFLGFKYRTRGYLESALSRMNRPTFIRETSMVAADIYSAPYYLSPLAKFACYLTLEQKEDYECSICLDSGNAFYSRFPSCSHLFHPVCLFKWFSHTQTKSPSMAISHQIPRISHTTIQSHAVATRIERRRAGRFRLLVSPMKRFHGQQVVVQCPICRFTQTF